MRQMSINIAFDDKDSIVRTDTLKLGDNDDKMINGKDNLPKKSVHCWDVDTSGSRAQLMFWSLWSQKVKHFHFWPN